MPLVAGREAARGSSAAQGANREARTHQPALLCQVSQSQADAWLRRVPCDPFAFTSQLPKQAAQGLFTSIKCNTLAKANNLK